MKLLAARLRQADEIIASLAFLPAKARVAYALLGLAENLGEETDSGAVLIPRIINQGDIAAMAGVARENASRILSEWERKNLVTKSSGSYRSMEQSSKAKSTSSANSIEGNKKQIPQNMSANQLIGRSLTLSD